MDEDTTLAIKGFQGDLEINNEEEHKVIFKWADIGSQDLQGETILETVLKGKGIKTMNELAKKGLGHTDYGHSQGIGTVQAVYGDKSGLFASAIIPPRAKLKIRGREVNAWEYIKDNAKHLKSSFEMKIKPTFIKGKKYITDFVPEDGGFALSIVPNPINYNTGILATKGQTIKETISNAENPHIIAQTLRMSDEELSGKVIDKAIDKAYNLGIRDAKNTLSQSSDTEAQTNGSTSDVPKEVELPTSRIDVNEFVKAFDKKFKN